MKYACSALPEGYREIFRVDLQQNRRQNVIVSVWSVALLLLALIPIWLARPQAATFGDSFGLPQVITMLVGMIVYVLLHEAVHGVLFWWMSRQRPSFGFTLQYAYAGSDAYYRRGPYLVIALAPVVLWGAVLAILSAVAPPAWYWTVQIIQLINISGAAGDLYVTWKFSRMPADLLVQDAGIRMVAYAPAA